MKKVKLMALILAFVAAFMAYQQVNKINELKPVEIIKTSVIVATQDIPQNTTITKEMIKLTSIPIDEKIYGSIQKEEDAIGQIANTKIIAGEQIITDRIVNTEKNTKNSFAYKIPTGMRTWTTSVSNLSGVSGLLKVGDHVDILCSYTQENMLGDGTWTSDQVSRVIAQNMEIIALDQVLTQTVTDKDGKTTESPASYSTVTFFCTPEQLQLLQAAVRYGEIYMTLRGPRDEKIVSFDPVSKSILEGDLNSVPTTVNNSNDTNTENTENTIETIDKKIVTDNFSNANTANNPNTDTTDATIKTIETNDETALEEN